MYRVCITGGSGCLGSHLIRLLARDPVIKAIRSIDFKPLNINTMFPDENWEKCHQLEAIQANICDKAAMKDVTKDCDVVFHAAAHIDVRTFPDMAKMEAINEGGTQNIVQACLTNNIPRLIFTSSIDVIVGQEDHVVGDSLQYAERPLIYHYGVTKKLAEKLVLAHDQTKMENGQPLRVLVLRPHAMFGEGGIFLIGRTLKTASQTFGVHPGIGTGGLMPLTYVGNVAWGHIQAWKTSLNNSTICGRPYIIEDDTPKDSYHALLQPFLASRGYRFSNVRIPFVVASGMVQIVQTALSVLRPFVNVNADLNKGGLEYLYRRLMISEERDHRADLNYKPLYDHKTAVKRSLKFYDRIDLDEV